MTERKGRFITFEGADGAGKSTQMRLFAERLRSRGWDVIETQEPGGTGIGRQIRQVLLDPENERLCPVAEMLLYFAARAQNFDQVILPSWERGAIVLSDRFTDSTLAYQGAGRGLGEDVVMQLHDIACHGLQPDLTIYLDIDTATGLARAQLRGAADRMDAQAPDFHRRVREAYLELVRRNPGRMVAVDAQGTVHEVADRVWDAAKKAIA